MTRSTRIATYVVWQKAMELTVQVYRLSSFFPPTETYRLTAQVTRAAASVPANIAEGHFTRNKERLCSVLVHRKRLINGNGNVLDVGGSFGLCERTRRDGDLCVTHRG